MGAWGKGAFDNDGALDFLEDLCELAGLSWRDDDRLVGEVTGAPVDARVAEVLREVGTGADQAVDQLADEAYASLGLLAFALSSPQPEVQPHTSMGSGGSGQPEDLLGLGYGMHYLRLMDADRARALLPLAPAVIEVLFDEDGIWVSKWFEEAGLSERRIALERLLVTGSDTP